jgi:mRNA-degrading endonuclease RelE of RelBE toxin-antitoxin system
MKKFDIVLGETFKKEFRKLLKKHRSLLKELENLSEKIATNPIQGTPLGRNCYKIRLAIKSKGQGKSGGARVISCVVVIEKKVVLISIYNKAEHETISDKKLNKILEDENLD